MALGTSRADGATAENSVFAGSPEVAVIEIGAFKGTGNLVSTQLNAGKSGTENFVCLGADDGAFAELDSSCNP